MTPPRILIAGIGNIFLGDDAFGVEVAQRLMRRPQHPGAQVTDFGIRGLDLTYALLDGCEVAILIDAMPRGGTPGTLYLIEPDVAAGEASAGVAFEGHSMDPVKVLRTVAAMGGRLGRVLVLGCEPTPSTDDDDMSMGLSPPVSAAVDEAVSMVESLVHQLLESAKQPIVTSAPPARPALSHQEIEHGSFI